MKKQVNTSKLSFHFIIGFLIYQIIGDIISSFVNIYFEKNSSDLFLKYGENNVYIVYFLITALIIHFIATSLSTSSLIKQFEITKNNKKGFIISIFIFFIIIAIITGLLNKERFLMVFIINSIVLLLMLGYVYAKVSSISDFDISKESNVSYEQLNTYDELETGGNKEMISEQNNLNNNPFASTIEENQNPVEPTQNVFEKPVEQPQQQSTSYLDIFTNPPKNDNPEEK